jgi:diaminopimelate epimerase
MILTFSKYQGTGNDFIMVLERNNTDFKPDAALISKLCDRRFGVGADGLIIIKDHGVLDFEVDYYNADGTQSFCGNGARCSVQFANDLLMLAEKCKFMAIDGEHEASFSENGDVKLLMHKVTQIESIGAQPQDFILDTGSPHYVRFCDLGAIDILEFGRAIRYNERFKERGINVNTACIGSNEIYVETYERGVEQETYSCGTGVTAVALAAASIQNEEQGITAIRTKGCQLRIYWKKTTNGSFDEIFLEGPAKKVYDGTISI